MKKTACALSACLLMAGAAQATVISVANWDGNNASDTGVVYNQFTVTSAVDGNDILYSWTRTGNLDGGTINDTLSFDLRLEAWTGSSYTSPDVTLGTAYNLGNDYTGTGSPQQHFGPGGDLDNNQSFQLSIENVSFTQGEALGWGATFDGFSAISKFIAESEDVYFGADNAEVVNVATANQPFTGPLQVLTVSMIGSDNNNRFRDLDFSFTTAIPEPAVLSFIAIFGGGLLVSRRLFKF
ncbi:hypothetical protein P4B35_22455 [Pontiellaceae bacterium B12227]|nr:hypothetical protein [Pontiellaceae bacterium B12227]